MIDYFLLSEHDVFGQKKLEIFNHGYLDSITTDFADIKSMYTFTNHDWWLKKSENKIFGTIVGAKDNGKLRVSTTMKGYGIRPAVKYSDIKDLAVITEKLGDYGLKIEFGSYPQHYLDAQGQIVTNTLYETGDLIKTQSENIFMFNNDLLYRIGDNNLWIGQSPLTWIVDLKSDIAVTEYIIDGSFNRNYNDVVYYLKNYFGKLIIDENKIKEYKRVLKYKTLLNEKQRIERELSLLNNEILTLKRNK